MAALCRVGDTFRFGQSSRMYVLTGPQDLMPQEGLSKQQKKQLAMLEAAQVGCGSVIPAQLFCCDVQRTGCCCCDHANVGLTCRRW